MKKQHQQHTSIEKRSTVIVCTLLFVPVDITRLLTSFLQHFLLALNDSYLVVKQQNNCIYLMTLTLFWIAFPLMLLARFALFVTDMGQLHTKVLKIFVTSSFTSIWKSELYKTCKTHQNIKIKASELLLLATSSLVYSWSSSIRHPTLMYTGTLFFLVILLIVFITKMGCNWCTVLLIQDTCKHIVAAMALYLLSGMAARVEYALHSHHLRRLNIALHRSGIKNTTLYSSETEKDVQNHYVQSTEKLFKAFVMIVEDMIDMIIYFKTLLNYGWRCSMYVAFTFSAFKLLCDVIKFYMEVMDELACRDYYRYVSITDLEDIIVGNHSRTKQNISYLDDGNAMKNSCDDTKVLDIPICSICLCTLNAESIQLHCQHMFHEGCVLSLLKCGNHARKKCPLCRAPVKRNTIQTLVND